MILNLRHIPSLLFLTIFTVGILFSSTSGAATQPVASLVHVDGQVEVLTPPSTNWVTAVSGQKLFAGDIIQTKENGKAAVLMADETLLQLNHHSRFILKQVTSSAAWREEKGFLKTGVKAVKSIYKLLKGGLWLRNKNRTIDADIETSVVTAGIRGTEFSMKINADGTVHVAVLEGVIKAWNSFGALQANAGEEVVTVPGLAPKKRLLVNPLNAVQWTLTIPDLFDFSSFHLISGDRTVLLDEEKQLRTLTQNGSSGSVLQQIRFASVLRDLGEHEEASSILKQLLQNHPNETGVLTGMGWVLLDLKQPKEALILFNRIKNPTEISQIGQAAALINMGKLQNATQQLTDAKNQHLISEGKLTVLEAILDIHQGNIIGAKQELETLLKRQPEFSLAWSLLALTSVVLGESDTGVNAAKRATDLSPQSTTAHTIHGYALQATFDLPAAAKANHTALDLNPSNVTALINLATIQFGSDYLDDALLTLGKAKDLAPDNAEVHQLYGFILFAQGKQDKAIASFRYAITIDSGLAEPHLGLSLAYMRQGRVKEAMQEITTAVLLDPQRAIFLSYWGKMLHQLKRFDKALDVLKRARTLDPRDPTPLLYRAIILRDLNRPAEAIRTLNLAIKLNGNKGIYRSRLLLDKDLAVKNVDLSRLFNQLGLTAWAKNKALSSIKQNYLNHSAHLFYAGALGQEEDRDHGFSSEMLLARLLMPANANSFNQFNEYTIFFEQPDTRKSLTATLGNHDQKEGEFIVTGAIPESNIAYQAGVFKWDTDGWRKTNYERTTSIAGIMKWEPTIRDSILVTASALRSRQGDSPYPRFEYDTKTNKTARIDQTQIKLELGYHRKLTPNSDLIAHLSHVDSDGDLSDQLVETAIAPGLSIDIFPDTDFERPYTQFQLQYIHKIPQHQIMAGSFFYTGKFEYKSFISRAINANGIITPLPPIFDTLIDTNQEMQFQSLYLSDNFQVTPDISLEAALYWDHMRNVNPTTDVDWRLKKINPRLGVIWKPTPENTFRLAGFRHLLPFISSRIDPTDIAGIPIARNATEGSQTEEFDISWEHEWETGFLATNLYSLRTNYRFKERVGNQTTWDSQKGKLTGIEIDYNQLILSYAGLAAEYRYIEAENKALATADRQEHRLKLGLRLVYPNGFSAGIDQTYRNIEFENRGYTEHIWITDMDVGYEFPGKKGVLTLALKNLFDQHFNWVTDRFTLKGRAPERQATASFSLYF